MSHYYNEVDPSANEWTANLMAAGEIPYGRIDPRPIQELTGADLAGVTQFHTFNGISGWALALRLAGWPLDREVWCGSAPCQPFSSAGKGGGVNDERHLWPDFFRLIKECRPATVFGEQVGSKAGIGWLDGVQADMEGEGYTCGAVIVGAHSVGAPHIRQRIYWVADRRLSDSERAERRAGPSAGVAVPNGDDRGGEEAPSRSELRGTDGPWSDYRIIPCSDGKARRTGTRVFPLAHGIPRRMEQDGPWRKGLARGASRARIGMLKGAGNAIVPALAAEFIRAFLESGE